VVAVSLQLQVLSGEQFTGAGASTQAVQAFWQHVDEEAADELVGDERYALVPIAALDPVVLPV